MTENNKVRLLNVEVGVIPLTLGASFIGALALIIVLTGACINTEFGGEGSNKFKLYICRPSSGTSHDTPTNQDEAAVDNSASAQPKATASQEPAATSQESVATVQEPAATIPQDPVVTSQESVTPPQQPIAPPQQPIATPTWLGSGSDQEALREDEAVALLREWLVAKAKIFAPPFDISLAERHTSGQLLYDITKPNGSVDWLSSRGYYYRYSGQRVGRIWAFDYFGDKKVAELLVEVTETTQLYSPNGIVENSSTTSTKDFRYYFERNPEGVWKISNYCEEGDCG